MSAGELDRMNNRVLVVDDDITLRGVMAATLLAHGFEVSHAPRVLDVRAFYDVICPDVVVLDWKLPDGDGLELMPELQRVWPEARIIIITGHATFDAAFEAARRGAFRFLTKPFHVTELVGAVAAACEYKSRR